MSDRKYANPLVHVVMKDGTEFSVQTLNPDLTRYERTATKHEWAGPGKEPISWMTFLAWSAGRREGLVPLDVTFEMFRDELCIEVSSPSSTPVPPTGPGPGPG